MTTEGMQAPPLIPHNDSEGLRLAFWFAIFALCVQIGINLASLFCLWLCRDGGKADVMLCTCAMSVLAAMGFVLAFSVLPYWSRKPNSLWPWLVVVLGLTPVPLVLVAVLIRQLLRVVLPQ